MRRIAVITAGLALALAVPGSAQAQQGEVVATVRCESQNNRHQECRFQAQGDVTVHVSRQLSRTRCVYDRNWGTFDGGVWVDYGCRAEFVARRPPSNRPYRPVGGSHQTVNCESMNNAYRSCEINGIDTRSVHLERQLSGSPCIRGTSWGVSDGEASPPGIWVQNGCRATFSYTTGGFSFSPYGGTPHDFELPCESLRGAWNHCDVQQVRNARVQIIAGNDACTEYKAWGVDDTGIWVRNDCQGAFRVVYRH
jgi:hypothetical protein